MKVLKGGTGEKDQFFSKEYLKRADDEQNRRRICGAEVEAYIGLATASSLMERSAPVLERLAKDTGNGVRIKQASTLLSNATKKMGYGVSAAQLISIANNCRDVTITISSTPVDGCCNVDWKAMQAICDAALEGCCKFCGSSRSESKKCGLRKALELVPGVKQAFKGDGADECPFAGKEVEFTL